MPGRRRQHKVKKRYKVKFYSATIREKLLPILKMLDAGNYPAKIARFLGMSKQHVSYYIKKMKKAGLIRRKRIKWPAFYEVTVKGKKFLTRCKGFVPGFLFRLHRCGFKYPILRDSKVMLDWREVPQACGHWTSLIGREGGVKVTKTTRHIIVWCESITGEDPDELLLQAKGMADRVAASLCAKYGFKLGPGRLVPKKHIGVYDPAAELLSRYFEVTDDVGKIDRSEGMGEIDWFSAKAAKDYLLMPSRVQHLEQRVESLHGDIQELIQVLKEALTPREQPSPQPLKDRRYIT